MKKTHKTQTNLFTMSALFLTKVGPVLHGLRHFRSLKKETSLFCARRSLSSCSKESGSRAIRQRGAKTMFSLISKGANFPQEPARIWNIKWGSLRSDHLRNCSTKTFKIYKKPQNQVLRFQWRFKLSSSCPRLQQIFSRKSRSLQPMQQKTELRFLLKQLQTSFVVSALVTGFLKINP